jgi:hypothetical protein
MILTLAILAGIAAALMLVLQQLRKAPIGYEDAHGFHLVRQVKGSGILRRGASNAPAGRLKGAGAGAHS